MRRLALLGLMLGFGCGNETVPLTQITVSVNSDLSVPDEINLLTIDITGVKKAASARNVLKDDQDLPGTVSIVRDGNGSLGPITIRAAAWLESTQVVERTVTASFKERQTKGIVIDLDRACVNIDCPSGQTCGRGVCRPIGEAPSVPPRGSSGTAGMPGGTSGKGGGGGGNGASGRNGGSGSGITGSGGNGSSGITGSGGASGAGGITGGGGASGEGGGASGEGGGGSGGTMSMNHPPRCTITQPTIFNRTVDAMDPVTFLGGCTDPDGGTVELEWRSDINGPFGSTAMVTKSDLTLGTHKIVLCGTDASDSSVTVCSAAITVTVRMPAAPTAAFTATQSGNPAPFNAGAAIVLSASTSTGKSLSYAFSDNFIGDFASSDSSSTANMTSPEIGNHDVTLTVTDLYGRTATITNSFVVRPAAPATTLVQAFASVNTTLNGAAATALTVDSLSQVLVGTPTPTLYRFDGTMLNATPDAPLDNTVLPGAVRALLLIEGEGRLYIGTDAGLVVCLQYMPTAVIMGTNCTTLTGGSFPDNQINAIARITDGNSAAQLVLGTKKGLFYTSTLDGSTTGTVVADTALMNEEIAALAAVGPKLYIATANKGLYTLDLPSGTSDVHAGAPSMKLSSITRDASGLFWLGSDGGFGSYDAQKVNNAWSVFTTATDPAPHLVSNHVRAIESARVTIGTTGTTTRDIVWLATDAGVSRYDSSSPMFMTLTMSDGLPSNDVLSSVLLPSGDKVFGTAAGLALYSGK